MTRAFLAELLRVHRIALRGRDTAFSRDYAVNLTNGCILGSRVNALFFGIVHRSYQLAVAVHREELPRELESLRCCCLAVHAYLYCTTLANLETRHIPSLCAARPGVSNKVCHLALRRILRLLLELPCL